ncbi:hypothetical protein CR513_51486, partial [Mucuna pruriens]
MSVIQRRGHLSSSSAATSLLENLPRHFEESLSETEKANIVRGGRLDYQPTLVDPILKVLVNGGEPSPLLCQNEGVPILLGWSNEGLAVSSACSFQHMGRYEAHVLGENRDHQKGNLWDKELVHIVRSVNNC